MEPMDRGTYIRNLQAVAYVEHPTIEQMLSVCPHLTPEQAIDGLMGEGRSGYIALPPVLMQGTVRIANYYDHRQAPGRPPTFCGGRHAHRTRRSFADGKSHGITGVDYLFAAEAMAYAEKHWPEWLQKDDWADSQTVHLQEPMFDEEGRPGFARTVLTVTSTLKRSWRELSHGPDATFVERWDRSLRAMTIDPIVAAELKRGAVDANVVYNCARCGGGLKNSRCTACDVVFGEDQFIKGWNQPLPPQIVEQLRYRGHHFELDPLRLLAA